MYSATGDQIEFSLGGTPKFKLTGSGAQSDSFLPYTANTPATLRGLMNDGASAIGVILNATTAFTTAGAKLLSIQNATVEKAYFDLNGGLSTDGGRWVNVTTVNSATYDLLTSDDIVSVTYTATGAVTSLTLPTAQTVAGRRITIKDAGGNAGTFSITIDTEGAQTIDGSATAVINGDYGDVTLYCDGSNWFIIS